MPPPKGCVINATHDQIRQYDAQNLTVERAMNHIGITLTVLATSLLASCGGGGGDASQSSSNQTTANASATVSVSFPRLFDQGGTKVLPTYISHVITSTKYPLASITIQNTGAAFTAQVSIDLPTYGSPSMQSVPLAVGETKTIPISPSIDYTRLFQNTTTLPAAVNVSVMSGSSTLFSQSYPIQITGRNTVFWQTNGQSTVSLIATMVTPQDKAQAIQGVLRGAANRFPSGSMIGYQSATWPSAAYTISPGNWRQESFYLLAGESPSVAIDNVATSLGGADNNFSVFILDDANYIKWSAGQSASTCAISNAAAAGTVLQCAPQASNGTYHVVYYNLGTNILDRTVTRRRPMTKWEVTYYQANAIFDELRSRGLTYINLTGSGFFSSAQNVRYPSESLSGQGANCIDGSLLFASALEALGMEPVLAMSSQAGHAFAVVRCWQGSTDCVVPIETTMIGGTSTFNDAAITAGTNWDSWRTGGHLQTVDIKAMRALGLTPAPM
jgi:hypothetical protein